MHSVVKAKIVRIGNSQGIRIPKIWLQQLNLGEEVEMAVEPDQLVIRPVHGVREGWDEAFRKMAESGDDRPLEGFPSSAWDDEEWQW
jgi:antitoxin MazE